MRTKPYFDYRIKFGVLTALCSMTSERVEIGLIAEIMADYFAWHLEKYGSKMPADRPLKQRPMNLQLAADTDEAGRWADDGGRAD